MSLHTIAVVNGDCVLLALLNDLLTEEGYRVITYLTTDETYHHLRDTQPSLIILDVGLRAAAPSWSLLKLLQFDPRTAAIPVLVTTIDHQFIEAKRGLLRDAGCDILELPANFSHLLNKVVALIGPAIPLPDPSPPRAAE